MGKKKYLKEKIKILTNNKIKLKKGQKISIRPMVEESLKDSVISRLEGIICDNTDRYDESHDIKSEVTLLSQIKMADIITHTPGTKVVPTIVHVCTKKNSLDFDFAGDGIIADLLRSSTLGPTYNRIKDSWKNINTDDNTLFTNVMYIPNIFVFSNGVETLLSPFKVNLLMIAVPSFKSFKEDYNDDKCDDNKIATDYIGRIYGDIAEAAIKLPNCSDLIIDPFSIKITKDHQHDVINFWNYLIDSPRCKKVISSIWFSIEDEFNYVIFITEKGIKKLVENNEYDDNIHETDEELDEITDEIVSDINTKNNNKKKVVKDNLDNDD